MKFIFIAALLISSLIAFSCKKDNPIPPGEQTQINLNLEDVSCTEAWIKLTTTNLSLPAEAELTRDGFLAEFISLTADTILYVDSLLPNKTYNFRSIIHSTNQSITSSDLPVTTMDTTSHNFTWQTYTFGDPIAGSSELNDIVIIDENNIWAVGEIYLLDSLGQPDPSPYNLAKWDGQSWGLLKLKYQGFSPIIHTISFINEDDIWLDPWFHWDGQIIQQLSIDPELIGININKMWGNSEGLYVVGNNGKILYRNSVGSWSRIESGTMTNLNDIWGYNDLTVLTVASNILHSGEYRLLTISDNQAKDTLNWPYNDKWLKGVWFKNQYSPVYICGGGINIYQNNKWTEVNLPNYFTEAIRGTDYNNILAAGDFGFAAHFNGVSWKVLQELSGIGEYQSLAIKDNLVVLCGFESNGGIVGKALVVIGRQ